MQEAMRNLLDEIKFNSNLYHLFDNFVIKTASYNKELVKYDVSVDYDVLLDPRVYDEFNTCLNNHGGFNVKLNYNGEFSEFIILEYYKYFLNIIYKDGLFLKVLQDSNVEFNNQTLYLNLETLTIYEVAEERKLDLINCFKKLGLDIKIELIDLSKDSISFDEKIEKENDTVPEVIHHETKEPDFKHSVNNDFYTKEYTKVTVSDIKDSDVRIEFDAKIFFLDIRETRKGNKIYSIYVTDNNRSILVKTSESKSIDPTVLESLKVGDWISVRGGMTKDIYYNGFYCSPYKIVKSENHIGKTDDATEKRVELHLHTKMSAMDGVGSIDGYFAKAKQYGHSAIAITDHGSVQAFPEAQGIAKATGIKLIYGMEGYIVENKYVPAYNPKHISLNESSYVVFDLETTGLSNHHDKIIECGFAKVVNGQIVETFQTFVNPLRRLSPKIVELTSITDEMLIGAPTIDQLIPKLLDFIGDSILVAHNASFDIGFLNAALRDNGYNELNNGVIDTLDLAHCIYPQLKKFNLGSLCKLIGVEYDEVDAHRADYDASVLASCFISILYDLSAKEIHYHDELNSLSPLDAYKSQRPYHMTFLVKNDIGLKNLYKLVSISNIDYITDVPNIPRSIINDYREGLLIGSACFNGEIFDIAATKSFNELKKAMEFYDYIEIQPYENYEWLLETSKVDSEEILLTILHDIIKAANETGKLIVATGDTHYIDDSDRIFRDVIINAKSVGSRFHPLKHKLSKHSPKQHYRTTQEMIDGIDYVNNKDLQKQYVVDNTNYIASLIEDVYPVKDHLFTPHVKGVDSDKEIRNLCETNLHKLYGLNPPTLIVERMNKELDNIIKFGFSIIYYLAYRLVKKSNEDGYLVGSRGSVGSSFVASLCGITEVNPLAPHYLCPSCQYSEFIEDKSIRSGFDLEPKICPHCGQLMYGNGQNIPFETFLGLNCDKTPDIDLNFSRDYQSTAHDYTKVLCGENNVFRAGTISTVAEKTAFGYARGYFEDNNIDSSEYREADLRRLAIGCTDVKRTTGQHPAGIVVIPEDMDVYDFTPIQYPADEISSSWKTTHFNFKSMHDEVLKLDILGHLDPMAVRMLKDLTGIEPESIPMNDPDVLSLFTSLKSLNVSEYDVLNKIGTSGVPEFGTSFVKGVLLEAKPTKFSDLVQISGLTHGTDVWNDNASSLIKDGTCSLRDVIGCRDDIMTDLIRYGMDKKDAFDTMEFVRKGNPTKSPSKWPAYVDKMRKANVPEWYIESCHKIKYMFPKAHAVAYVVMALRVAWFKVHYPIQYYAAFFSVRCTKFDIDVMSKGHSALKEKVLEMQELVKKGKDANGKELSNTVYELYDTLELALEMTARGYTFQNVSVSNSDAINFKVSDDGKSLIPPFIVLDGLGDTVAKNVVEQRSIKPFTSKDDLQTRGGINKTTIELMNKMGCLKELNDEDQLSFDLGL